MRILLDYWSQLFQFIRNPYATEQEAASKPYQGRELIYFICLSIILSVVMAIAIGLITLPILAHIGFNAAQQNQLTDYIATESVINVILTVVFVAPWIEEVIYRWVLSTRPRVVATALSLIGLYITLFSAIDETTRLIWSMVIFAFAAMCYFVSDRHVIPVLKKIFPLMSCKNTNWT